MLGDRAAPPTPTSSMFCSKDNPAGSSASVCRTYGTLEKYLTGGVEASVSALEAVDRDKMMFLGVMGRVSPGKSQIKVLLVHALKQSAIPP